MILADSPSCMGGQKADETFRCCTDCVSTCTYGQTDEVAAVASLLVM